MKRYEVKLKIDASPKTDADGLRRWLLCLGPAVTVVDIRLVSESIKPDQVGHVVNGEPGRFGKSGDESHG